MGLINIAFCVFIGLLSQNFAFGQIGVRLKYNLNNYTNWDNALKESFSTNKELYASSYSVGVDHWFRLKKHRIEFLPEIAYSYSATNFDNNTVDRFAMNTFSFNFNTQIYALDLEGDCDCPTFSKPGPSLNKGLFFLISPGLTYFDARSFPNPILSSLPLPNGKNRGFSFSVGTGLGIDIGISDLLTITPMASYYFYSKMPWQNMVWTSSGMRDVETYLNQTQIAVRLGFRMDYNNSRKKYRR